ncbi:hypothetical protein IMSAGC002_02949 [Lachnospiraceae bacterium]|jgi:predicted HTH domain antitoxin|nr:hypothetical protein [Lachnospiraceae bacterium]GFH91691.1 hypothetical protein IMSAGC002_02949 [Lachnospiraceae bacterium]
MEIRKRKGKQVRRLAVTEQQHQEDLQRLRGLRPIDDDFMRCLFKDNIPLAEFVLRIITDKTDLIITDCETQKDMKRLAGARSICLDAYGTDLAGKKYDLEVQRQDKGADPHRARYHSSVMDIENLHSSQEFKELPDTYTIFILEKDFYGEGEAIYPIERINLATGKSFEDWEHILYVNGEYRGESDIGKLMHDFNCTQADDMNFELMAERTRYLKENPKGVQEMCKVMEDMRNESLREVAKRMLADGMLTLEKIAEYAGLPLDEVKKLKEERTA